MIIRNDGPVKMTMQDLLKLFILPPATPRKSEGGDPDDSPYLLAGGDAWKNYLRNY